MVEIKKLLEIINKDKNCSLLSKKKEEINNLNLPEDLKFYFENYKELNLFLDEPYGSKIVGIDNFKNANKAFYPEGDVIWEELEGDISNDWFIIGENIEMSQYITIDLNKERIGRCYDSFYEIHADPDFSPIIALSFTELLKNLYSSKGKELYWNEPTFESLGIAYPDEE
ncbi:SMI1/KNR4 family protein [uncultured Aquimarina sp.]|uniref:SMI1/KNR4 family protein n=1 Tax=uncultured Aquimarina sp. TaxID=575652 RepID=UPI0026316218|nr:SMI1/KNR4 family protein [uncultured Aquimarina sp.]